jgi:uncharacterized membrane protein YfcA
VDDVLAGGLAALSPLTLLLLVGAAFAAGFVDAIAGGGGILTVPALLAAGLPPHLAFGTNKGQSVWGTAAALAKFARAGLVDRARALPAFVAGFAGSLGGAQLVLLLPPATLRPLVLALLVVVALWLALRRGSASAAPKPPAPLHPVPVAVAIAVVVGAYDGFFGPGTGTFLIVLHARLLGDALDRASANAKVVNAASNLAALALFASRGVVVWSVALPMALAQVAGGTVGSHVAIRGGAAVVRRVVLVVVVVLVLKLARDLVVG